MADPTEPTDPKAPPKPTLEAIKRQSPRPEPVSVEKAKAVKDEEQLSHTSDA